MSEEMVYVTESGGGPAGAAGAAAGRNLMAVKTGAAAAGEAGIGKAEMAESPEARHERIRRMVFELEGNPNTLRAYLGIRFLDADYGYTRAELEIDERHQNPIGTIHGGVVYSLADTLGGSCNATLGQPGPTISSDIYYLGSMVGVKKVIGEAHVIKKGRRVNVIEEVITDEAGRLLVRCTQQYMNLGRNVAVEARDRFEGGGSR